MGQNAKCTSPYSLTPPQRYTAGGTELVPVGSGYRKRQSVMDPSQALSAPAASRAKSNDREKSRHGTQMLFKLNPLVHASSSLVQSRQVLLGVYVLPQLFDAVRRGRLSDFLSHLMHSTRREIQNLNAMGVAPRGRPGKPLERIEVDLSFLRSLDQSRNVRVAAQRIFVSSHVDMYRELSTILDEVMMKFRAVIKEIVGADTGDWSYFAYAAEALPDTPSQVVHQDRGGVPRLQYFTCIIPVTANAAPTEFCPPHETAEFWKYQDPVLFDGQVWHRGPAVIEQARRVLSLVACKEKEDKNHESALPFRWKRVTHGNTIDFPILSSTDISAGAAPPVGPASRLTNAAAKTNPTAVVKPPREGDSVEAQNHTHPNSREWEAVELRMNQLRDELNADELDVDALESALRRNTEEDKQLNRSHQALRRLTQCITKDSRGEESRNQGQETILSLHCYSHHAPDVVSTAQEPNTADRDDGSRDTLTTRSLESTSNAPISTLLSFELIDVTLSITLEACAVNVKPYGMLSGTIEIDWRGNNLPVILQDEVRAVRAEGSCYLLCILDLIREAERSQTFRSRRISHPELHETFQERWEIILAMVIDREATGLRRVICNHLLDKHEQFQRDFPLPPNHTAQQWQDLRAFGDSLGIHLKSEGTVQRNALEFLRPSTHATEGHMKVLLDWLGHKVAVLNLLQIPNENGTPQFFHSSVVNLITDEAVLLLKVLNLERHGRERAGLNHFNRVSGSEPVEFLQDFLPVWAANETSPLGSREVWPNTLNPSPPLMMSRPQIEP